MPSAGQGKSRGIKEISRIMKKYALPALLCALFIGLVILTACSKTPGGSTETTPDGSAVTGAVTDPSATGKSESDTIPSINEDVTAIPRYDYFEADVLKDVTLDPAVYTDMKLTIPTALQITQQSVDEYMQSMRIKFRVPDNGTEKVKDQPLKLGDDAYIYYCGYLNGEEFKGGSNMDSEMPSTLTLGSGQFIPGFEDALVGVIPADTSCEKPFSFNISFPDDYGNADLKGKEVEFRVVVEYAVRYTLPEVTREFIEKTLEYKPKESVYPSDKAFFDEYYEYIRVQLESQIASDVEYAKTDAMWNYLTEKIECRNLNADEIKFYYDSYVSEIEHYYSQYKSYYGESFTAVYPEIGPFALWYMGKEPTADWKAELQKLSELMVKKDMITHAIGEKEGIESITNEEYQAEIDYWVEQYYGYMNAAEIVQSMGETYLRESAFAIKMSKWLTDHCTFTYAD